VCQLGALLGGAAVAAALPGARRAPA